MLYTEKALRRFWSKTERSETGCVVWSKGSFESGYGQFWYDGRPWPASRWIMQAYAGRKLKEFEYVLHSCDNKGCVNTAHLRVGTPKENSEDAVSRNRLFEQQKTHCVDGHPYSGDNLYITAKGHRQCKACRKKYKAKSKTNKLV